MEEKKIVNILKKVGAVITDSHIVLSSGRHTDSYINPDKILPYTKVNSDLGNMFAKKYKNTDVDVVIGPAYGGIIFSQWVAYHLSQMQHKEIIGIFTEKTPERHQIFERGFDKLVVGTQYNWSGSYMIRAAKLFSFYEDHAFYVSPHGVNFPILMPLAYHGKAGYIHEPLMHYIRSGQSLGKVGGPLCQCK